MLAADIHAAIGEEWPAVLHRCGVSEDYLRGRGCPGPCPACGGRDRYTFDNRSKRGDFICRHCGSGDGFQLLMKLTGADFATVRKRVMLAAGLDVSAPGMEPIQRAIRSKESDQPARLPSRVRDMLRSSSAVEDCEDARRYLESRGLECLPPKCSLRAHSSIEYWRDRRRIGWYAALIGVVRDINGVPVTAHATYLEDGWKVQGQESRKLLSSLTGREGCAIRLVPLEGDTLGIAEGIETALSALKIHRLPTWAAINAGLLAKFEPPPQTRRLVVYADNDAPGLLAAGRCLTRLQGRVDIEIVAPPPVFKDWNDVIREGWDE